MHFSFPTHTVIPAQAGIQRAASAAQGITFAGKTARTGFPPARE